jgi:predicted RNA-binding protein associated with RNAse of E/G family
MKEIVVSKRNEHNLETWRYRAYLLEHKNGCIVLEATFDRDDINLQGMLLAKGDRFIETYYTNRWYNIFEIHAREDGQLRGWYCNIGKPAEFDGQVLSYIDLALDLLVFPDGRQVILDEDEFAELEITDQERKRALEAMEELQSQFREKELGTQQTLAES